MSQKTPAFKAPQVDKVLREEVLKPWHAKVQARVITQIIRNILSDIRTKYLSEGQKSQEELSATAVANLAKEQLDQIFDSHLVKVINGTGVIINTNLGRAPLPESALEAVLPVLESYSNLELDLTNGKRGERLSNMELLLQLITGCEAALLVNNNAASVLLAINALSKDKEVIVSRSELVEIGGSFRLPDVIACAEGRLKEIGTTNRTRIEDYEKAINSDTGMIFKCHRSNFEIKGFFEEATVAELRSLASAKGIPLIEDLGSGVLVPLEQFGFASERTVQDCLNDGVDLVLFSGDKLLGGPQAGLVIGKKAYIEILRRHPIYRALRLDKVLIALLECVLKEYLSPTPEAGLPVLAMANESPAYIKKRVEDFISRASKLYPFLTLNCVETESTFGGGTSPGQTQKSFGVGIRSKSNPKGGGSFLTALLRTASPPVIARLQEEITIVDFRTVRSSEEPSLLAALAICQKDKIESRPNSARPKCEN
jgi:L-seryl-tRNA(Ser) seleniumtransferase